MRRKSTAVLALTLGSAFVFNPFVLSKVHSQELNVGAVIGSVGSTDIRAFVNGAEIRSMNIDGNTAIFVEDLRGHGFDIAWEPVMRQVSILPDSVKSLPSTDVSDNGLTRVGAGSIIADVLATDIRTFALGNEVPSYNVGGKTAVFLQDLTPLLGSLDWNEKSRTVTFNEKITTALNPQAARRASYPLQVEQVSSKRLSIQFTDDGMFLENNRIGFEQEGRAMLSLEKMAKLLNYQSEVADNGLYMYNNTYGFQIAPNMETEYLFWFNSKVSEGKLTFPAIERDGELYVSEYDLKQLFGYTGNWDSDKRRLDIDYANFLVKDFGISEHTDNYWYSMKGLLVVPNTMDCRIYH
ncbi:hypothetical protein [Paenibacillus sp. N3.4]|uniref:hypothetical protein n=1 Tax=Paenibacillus sp. N3.4 TaxID=2603222 RepID=UPI0011C74BA6|nr:hypothetical protein [Paenibacillus sp. N3.4]TXK70849.1 hypothetical protein FU659_33325 [Paenibacillus sp. N3.4]